MVSEFMTERVKSSTAGLLAVKGLEPKKNLGKVSGVVIRLVGFDKHNDMVRQTECLNQSRQGV